MVVDNAHRYLYQVYQTLPSPLKGLARRSYDAYVDSDFMGPSYKREFINRFFDSPEEYAGFEREFEKSDIGAIEEEARREHERRKGHTKFAAVNRYTPARLYALIRKQQPETVIETGVCNGMSTLIMLSAMETNGRGELYSVDYPDAERLPPGEQPGWIVPKRLRHRWELEIGLSQEALPRMVNRVEEIDVFVHDTEAPILGEELEIVWPKLRPGATIVADDVHAGEVFRELQTEYSVDAGFVAPNVGYLVKRG